MQIRPHTPSADAAAELERIRFVSENFYTLQGWRWVPAGLLVMFLSDIPMNALSLLTYSKAILSIHPLLGLLLSGCLGLACYIGLWVWSWAMGRYYDARFGRVEPHQIPLYWPAIATVLTIGAQMLGYLNRFNRWTGLRISFSALAMATYFASRRGAREERRHYAWLALVFLGSSVIPVLTGPFVFWGWGPHPVTFMEILKFSFGLALVVAGLFDHALLVRSLPAPTPEEAVDSSDLWAEEPG